MKKLSVLALCTALALSASATSALAAGNAPALISPAPAAERQSGYDLYVDGKDTGKNACMMVPLRLFAEQLGFSVVWSGDGTVTVDDGTMHSTITIGEDLYQVVTSIEGAEGASAPFSLGTAPFVMEGTTYVPLELFEALLGNLEGGMTLENGVLSIRTALEETEHSAQIPSPFTDCGSLPEAEKLAGFQLKIPGSVGGSDKRVFRAVEHDLLEVIYQDGETETARIRKAPGREDVSGDYRDYADVHTVSVANIPVTMKGGRDGVSLAIWTDGGYTYSAAVETPISSDEMARLVSEIR